MSLLVSSLLILWLPLLRESLCLDSFGLTLLLHWSRWGVSVLKSSSWVCGPPGLRFTKNSSLLQGCNVFPQAAVCRTSVLAALHCEVTGDSRAGGLEWEAQLDRPLVQGRLRGASWWLPSPAPARAVTSSWDLHHENCLGFQEVKATQGWDPHPQGISQSLASPLLGFSSPLKWPFQCPWQP